MIRQLFAGEDRGGCGRIDKVGVDIGYIESIDLSEVRVVGELEKPV